MAPLKDTKHVLLLKDFINMPRVDYFDTFSPVVKLTTIQIVLSVVVSCSWVIRQLDVKDAVLYSYLSGEVYMWQPPGFTDSLGPNHVR